MTLKRDCRVSFLSCSVWFSPFFLNATVRHYISKFKDEDPEFVRRMIESFYVDDLVTGEDNNSLGTCSRFVNGSVYPSFAAICRETRDSSFNYI